MIPTIRNHLPFISANYNLPVIKKLALIVTTLALAVFFHIRFFLSKPFKISGASITSLPALLSQFVTSKVNKETKPTSIPRSIHQEENPRAFKAEFFPTLNIPAASLEELYKIQCTSPVDTEEHITFSDHLRPNEMEIVAIQEHLKTAKPGLIISVGTERSLNDLALSASNCTGLVVVDINPRVKAFVDFEVLLLRLAENRKDYLALSDPERKEFNEIRQQVSGDAYSQNDFQKAQKIWLQKKILPIFARLEQSNLPDSVKSYYLHHFTAFAKVYYQAKAIDGVNVGFHFSEDDQFFCKVQDFALKGRIIAVRGDISELSFLDQEEIAVVDISNIYDYTMVNFKAQPRFSPMVISVLGTGSRFNAEYYAQSYQPLTQEEEQEFITILEFLVRAKALPSEDRNSKKFSITIQNLLSRTYHNKSKKSLFFWGFSKKSLEELRELRKEYCLESPTEAICLLSESRSDWITRINGKNQEELQELFRDKGKLAARCLVFAFQELSPHVFRFLRENLSGWKEEEHKYLTNCKEHQSHTMITRYEEAIRESRWA